MSTSAALPGNVSAPVNVETFRDPDRPASWSSQMVALIRAGHYREGYEILAEKMPFVESQLRPYAERLAGKENYWTGTFAWIDRFVDHARPQKLLDVGCGVGPLAIEFARKGHQTWGIDVLPSMIERGRELIASLELTERARLVEGDIRRLEDSFDPGFFDCAVACDIFEHLDDPSLLETLRGIGQVVRPGGTVIIQTSPGRHYYWFSPRRPKLLAFFVPLAWLPDRLFTSYVRMIERCLPDHLRREHKRFYHHEYGHINCLDPVHLKQLMQRTGLTNVRTFAVHAHRGFKDEGCLESWWTRLLFGGKSIAARNVFGIATVPDRDAASGEQASHA